jgi:hypothetical protein
VSHAVHRHTPILRKQDNIRRGGRGTFVESHGRAGTPAVLASTMISENEDVVVVVCAECKAVYAEVVTFKRQSRKSEAP